MNRCGKNAKLEPTISDFLIKIDVGNVVTYTLVIPFNATFTKKKQTYHFSFLFFFFLFFFPGQF